MARQPRADHLGAWHHVMNRGARRQPIFKSDEHCGLLLTTIAETHQRFGLEIHAYAIMPNHFHLLVHSVRGNLSRAMRHLGSAFTLWINRLHGWDGPLFRGRFRNQVIEDPIGILTVSAYIHLNPVRAGLVRRLDQHAWTSHRAYLGLDVPPQWLSREMILDQTGGVERYHEYVQDYRIGKRVWPESFDADSGWFKSPLVSQTPWSPHCHAVRDPTVPPLMDEKTALKRVLELTGAQPQDLKTAAFGPRANPARRFAVWALDRSTSLTQREVGHLLGMSANQVARVLLALRHNKLPEPLEGWRERWLALEL